MKRNHKMSFNSKKIVVIMKNEGRMEASVKKAVMIAAAILFAVAIIWRTILEANDLGDRITNELANYGLNISSDELYQQAYEKNTSIAQLMEGIDMESAIAASEEVGLPSDINKVGEVYLLLADLGEDSVLTVFVVDERIELAFVQKLNSDEISPIFTVE